MSAGAPPADAFVTTLQAGFHERSRAIGAKETNTSTPTKPGANHKTISTTQYARKEATTAETTRFAGRRETNKPTQSAVHPRAMASAHDEATSNTAFSQAKAAKRARPPSENKTIAAALTTLALRRAGEKDAHRPTAARNPAFARTEISLAYVKISSNRGNTAAFIAEEDNSKKARAQIDFAKPTRPDKTSPPDDKANARASSPSQSKKRFSPSFKLSKEPIFNPSLRQYRRSL